MTNTPSVAGARAVGYPDKPNRWEIKLPPCRAYWHNFFKPVVPRWEGNEVEGEPEFSATLVIDKKIADAAPEWQQLRAALTHYSQRLFDNRTLESSAFNLGVRDGDEMENPIYHGCRVIRAKSKSDWPPAILMPNPDPEGLPKMVPFPPADAAKLGIGPLVRCLVSPYPYFKQKKGFGFNLRAVAILGYGEARVERDFSKSFDDDDIPALESRQPAITKQDAASQQDANTADAAEAAGYDVYADKM